MFASYENAAEIVSAMAPSNSAIRHHAPKHDVIGLIDHLVEAANRAAALGG